MRPPLDEWKKAIRREMQARLRAYAREGESAREAASQALCAAVQAHPFWREAGTVALFAALPSEPDLHGLWRDSVRRMVFPRIDGEVLEWVRVRDPDRELAGGKGDGGRGRLREPAGRELVPVEAVDLWVVPGLAFTASGGRLGRGGGYYDRALAGRSAGSRAVGVCFSFQLLGEAELPLEPHDQRVDAVLWG
jgi:5-formyltetrahydrofolate cyclo-ligase